MTATVLWDGKLSFCLFFNSAVCLLVVSRPSKMLVYLRDGSAQTSCHNEIEVADQTFYLIQSQYTDTGPTSPSADHITPGAWQGSHWSGFFVCLFVCFFFLLVIGMTRLGKIPSQEGFEPRIFRSRGGRPNHKASDAV